MAVNSEVEIDCKIKRYELATLRHLILVRLFHAAVTYLLHIFYMGECLTFYPVQDAGFYIPTSAPDDGDF